MKLATKLTYNGNPIEVINKLIDKRVEALGISASRSVIATLLQVFNSLKADTRKAPLVGNTKMYDLDLTSHTASWLRKDGYSRRVVRDGGHINWEITNRCRNLAGEKYIKGEQIAVYHIKLKNEHARIRDYWCLAPSEKHARDYAENVILARLLKKSSGMAQYAIGIAQAKASDKPMTATNASGSKQFRLAYRAAQITFTEYGKNLNASFFDALNFSIDAMKNGRASQDSALKRAANKIAGQLHLAFKSGKLDEDVELPFPEVKTRRTK